MEDFDIPATVTVGVEGDTDFILPAVDIGDGNSNDWADRRSYISQTISEGLDWLDVKTEFGIYLARTGSPSAGIMSIVLSYIERV